MQSCNVMSFLISKKIYLYMSILFFNPFLNLLPCFSQIRREEANALRRVAVLFFSPLLSRPPKKTCVLSFAFGSEGSAAAVGTASISNLAALRCAYLCAAAPPTRPSLEASLAKAIRLATTNAVKSLELAINDKRKTYREYREGFAVVFQAAQEDQLQSTAAQLQMLLTNLKVGHSKQCL